VHGDGGTDTDSGGGEGEPGALGEHEQRMTVGSPVESLWRRGGWPVWAVHSAVELKLSGNGGRAWREPGRQRGWPRT
jgi:hypothetical protein